MFTHYFKKINERINNLYGDSAETMLEKKQLIFNNFQFIKNYFLKNNTQPDDDKYNKIYSNITKSFNMFVGSIIVMWIIAKSISWFFSLKMVPILSCLGLFYSIQATYYKYRIWKDPSYVPPSCKCGGSNNDMLSVLKHSKSAMFYIPNSVFGMFYYSMLYYLSVNGIIPYLVINKILFINVLVSLSCFLSLYLWYVMVFEIKHICPICIGIYAINLLTFIYK